MLVSAKREQGDSERGAAMVEFVLVCLVLLPLMTAILQVAIFLHVRNTVRACAHEGARFGANFNKQPGDGAGAADRCIGASFQGVADGASATESNGLVIVTVNYHLPAFGPWGKVAPGVAKGHAVREPQVG